ncbi:MAG TPA: hypothetical protein DDW65_11975 [Firmicutes bacterium]|nr:hypothetical protein [Bacillota bacterium]
MKINFLARALLSIIFGMGLLCIGFYGFLMAVFSVSQRFYVPFVLIVTGVFIVLVVLGGLRLVNPRILTIILVSFLVICTVTVTGYETAQHYYKSLPTVNEQGVDLNEYKPFTTGTKAVRLGGPASLKIRTGLPTIDGATALYPLYSAFAQAVYPQGEYNVDRSEVMCNNTIGAYDNLIDGKTDIIFTARPSSEQLESAQKRGIELKLTPIGREAFVFFVNAKNQVKELSVSQIQDIYSGKITNWQEVGGNYEKIRAFQRPENSGSQTMLQKLMEGKTLMRPPKEDIATGMGEIIEETAGYRNYKNAIGYSFLFFATEMIRNNQIHLLKVNGVYPERNFIQSKKYPLVAEFYAVTAGSKNPNIKALIEWILSPEGQYLVEKTGYTPIK